MEASRAHGRELLESIALTPNDALFATRFRGIVFRNNSGYDVANLFFQGKTVYGTVPNGWSEVTGLVYYGQIPAHATHRCPVPPQTNVQADFVDCSIEYKVGSQYKTYDFPAQEHPDGSPIDQAIFTFNG
jgi:hypothetical protein